MKRNITLLILGLSLGMYDSTNLISKIKILPHRATSSRIGGLYARWDKLAGRYWGVIFCGEKQKRASIPANPLKLVYGTKGFGPSTQRTP
jgi:hypothetical protein